MAPPRRPGLTIEVLTAPSDDSMTLLLWTAVPVALCSPSMLAFRQSTDVLRVSDNATRGGDGFPVSNHAGNPTLQHWQLGGVAIFGYGSSRALKYARRWLERVYITETGGVAVRRR